jgi:hypothetical protein
MFSLRKINAIVVAAVAAATFTPSLTAQSLPDVPSTTAAAAICTPWAVAEFPNRIHVLCTTAVSGIAYFAVATSNANRAAHALALFSMAMATGRDLRIYYDPANTSGTAVGCQASNCRLADGVEVL